MAHKYGESLDVGALLRKEAETEKKEHVLVQEPKKEDPPKQDQEPRWFAKHETKILLTILIIISAFLLSQPASLSQIDKSIRDAVIAQYYQKAIAEIEQKNLFLDQQTKLSRADKKLYEFMQSNVFEKSVEQTTEKYKAFYRDNEGQTFLYSADPYYFFRLANNIIDYEMLGDVVGKGGESRDSLRFFPFGDVPSENILPYSLAYFYRILRLVNPATSLLTTTFYFPVVTGVFSVVVMFFIARRLTNTGCSFLTAFLFAIHPVFLFWNYAGYTDTHLLAMLASLITLALFVYTFHPASSEKQHILSGSLLLCALVFILFYSALIWRGMLFVVVVINVFLIILLIITVLQKKKEKKRRYLLVLCIVISILCYLLFYQVDSSARDSISFMLNINPPKELFPTSFGVITELEGAKTLGRFINAFGGRLGALFVVVFFYELFVVVKNVKSEKDPLINLFPFVWFSLLAVPAFLSTRFMFFALPPFVLIIGKAVYRIDHWVEKGCLITKLKINPTYKKLISILICCSILLFLVNPDIFTSKTKLPLVTQSFQETAEFIKTHSSKAAVIATDWDLGYAWGALSNRATFFDGGLFRTPRNYWMSRLFSANNENVSINILGLLLCGRDYDAGLFKYWIADREKEREFNEFLKKSNKAFRENTKKSMDVSLECDMNKELFVVVSEDMLYQSHIHEYNSQWNFRAADMRNNIRGLSEGRAIELLKSKHNLSDDDAYQAYYDAKSFKEEFPTKHVDRMSECQELNNQLVCDNSFVVDFKTWNAFSNQGQPQLLMFVKDGKKRIVKYPKSPVNFSMVVYAVGDGYKSILVDTDLTQTMLVRMFIGEKFENFEHVFTSQERPKRIVVYKMKQDKK